MNLFRVVALAAMCGAAAGASAVLAEDPASEGPVLIMTPRAGAETASSSRSFVAASGLFPGARRHTEFTLHNKGGGSSRLTLHLAASDVAGSPALAGELVVTLRERRGARRDVLWRGALSEPVTIQRRGVAAGERRAFALEVLLPATAPDSTQAGAARIEFRGSG